VALYFFLVVLLQGIETAHKNHIYLSLASVVLP